MGRFREKLQEGKSNPQPKTESHLSNLGKNPRTHDLAVPQITHTK